MSEDRVEEIVDEMEGVVARGNALVVFSVAVSALATYAIFTGRLSLTGAVLFASALNLSVAASYLLHRRFEALRTEAYEILKERGE